MPGFGEILFSILKLVFIGVVFVKLYLLVIVTRCKSKKRMDGKVVIITGANSGVGKETARDLLRRGAKVIMGCRNLEKARQAARELVDEIPNGRIIVKYIDCCFLGTVRAFAEDILKSEEKLDVLINNAGVCGDHSELTIDGFESLFQTNYLAPVLLTELLLPLLKKSAPSRVINVVSSIYKFGSCNVNTLAKDFRTCPNFAFFRYGDSKLLLIMVTRALQKEFEGSGVTVNAVDPGMARTMIARKRSSLLNTLAALNVLVFGRSAEEAAQTAVHLSVESIAHSDNGQYWTDCKPEATWKGNNPVVNDRMLEITRQALDINQKDA